MEERDIRLDQTKKVFEVLSNLIKENEPCSYRYLIYDLLGFEPKDYNILLQGMIITNALCDLNGYIDILNKLEKWLKDLIINNQSNIKNNHYRPDELEDTKIIDNIVYKIKPISIQAQETLDKLKELKEKE